MAFETSEFCQLVQSDLNDIAANNYPALRRERTGVLDAITSPQNDTGTVLQQQLDPGNGKKKTVIINYLQPGLIDDTLDAKADLCTDAGVEEANVQTTFDVTGFRGSEVMKFTYAELRKLCEAPSERRTMVIASKMSALLKAINRDIITELNTGVGGFYGGVAAGKNIQLLSATTPVSANPLGANELMNDFIKLGAPGKPIVAGLGKLQQYTRLANIGCCNQYGQDIANLNGELDYFWDIDVAGITGNADDFLAWAPGAVQLVTFNEYKGEFAIQTDDMFLGTLVDPVTGIEFDMKMYFDKCDELWKLALWLNFNAFVLPLDMYKTGDDREGTNNLFRYRATSA